MSDAPDTVTDALAVLASRGYTAEVQLIGGSLRWREGDATCRPEEAVVEVLYRFEGDSDPGDEMVVLGVLDPGTGLRGALASAYGPAADPDMLDHIQLLTGRYRQAK
jgi:hypothetical protein